MTTHDSHLTKNQQPRSEMGCPENNFLDARNVLSRANPSISTTDMCISNQSLIRFSGNDRIEQITVQSGKVWLTQTGSLEDAILTSGETYKILKAGDILIQGMQESRISVSGGTLRHSLPAGIRKIRQQINGLFNTS